MADGLLSDAEFGMPSAAPAAASPVPAPAVSAPAPPIVTSPPDADAAPVDPAARTLTIKRGTSAGPAVLTDEEFGLPPASGPAAAADGQGPLGNTQDDSWTSGALKGAATVAIKGLAHIPGQIGDVHDLARFLAAGAASLFDSRSASDIYKDMQSKDAQYAAQQGSISPGDVLPDAAQVAAPILAKTGSYQPTSEVGQLAQAGVEAASGGIGPGAGAAMVERTLPSIAERALPAYIAKTAPQFAATSGTGAVINSLKQAPLNAAAGIAGQGATDATGNPYIGLAASLAAPAAGDAAFQAAKTVGAPMFAGARPARVGQQLLDVSQDPAAVKSSLGLGDATGQTNTAIPGSTPTTGQVTGDYGLLAAQRKAETSGNAAFLDRQAQQNSAQRSTLASLAPPDADTMAPSQFINNHLSTLDQATDLAQQRITDHAQNLASTLGPGNAPDVNGDTLRNAIETARGQAKTMRNGLYNAVDPDGSLSIVATPAATAAKQIAGSVDPLGAPLSGDESRILTKVQNLPDVVPYKSMIALDQDITASMSAEKRSAGETPAWNRLSQIKGAVMGTINNAVDNQHAFQQSAVARGTMAPEDTMAHRLDGVFSDDAANVANIGAVAARSATGTGRVSGSRSDADVGFDGASNSSSRRVGQTASNQGIQTPPNPIDLALSGELSSGRARAISDQLKQQQTATENQILGADADNWRSLQRQSNNAWSNASDARAKAFDAKIDAIESKLTPAQQDALYGVDKANPDGQPHSDPKAWRDLASTLSGSEYDREGGVSAIANEVRSLPKVTDQSKMTDGERESIAVIQHAMSEEAKRGGDPTKILRDGFTERMRRDGGGEDAQELKQWHMERMKALMNAPNQAADAGAARLSGSPSSPTPSQAAQLNAPSQTPPLQPNFDQAAAARLAAAKASHADYARTYREGPLAAAIKTNGFADNFRQQSSALPARAVPKGDSGYQTVQAALKMAKNDPGAVSAIQDQALNPLRKALTPEGTIPQQQLAKWKSDYAPALKAIDEVRPGFSSQFDTAAKATDIMTRAGAARQNQMDQIQKSAAGQFLGKTSPVEVENTIGGMMTAQKNGPTLMRSAVQTMSQDPQALAGLRKAGIDWMARKFVNTAEAGTSGEKSVSSAAFQKFVANNRATLSELYTPQHVNVMDAVAKDLERNNRDLTGTRIKGSPGTAKDLSPLVEKAIGAAHGASGHGALGSVIGVGLYQAYEHAGLKGAAAAAAPIAAYAALNHLRSAGLSKEQAMFKDALLNPDRARYYISKVPNDPKVGPLHALSSSLRRELISTPIIKEADQRHQ